MNSIIGRLAVCIAALCIFIAPCPAFAATPANSKTEQKTPPASMMKTVIIGVLILASVISIFLIVERAIALRQESVIPTRLAEAQSTCHNAQDLMTLRTACNAQPSPYGRLLACCIDHLHLSREDNVELLQTRARAEVVKMERGIVVLEIITGVGPLLGLVGTIFGLITLFKGMGVEVTSEQTAMFSEGISLALEATLLGLAVAIPSLIGWSYYNRKIEAMVVEMENLCDEFLRGQYQRAG
jgi:biopolymer transport protein ExbB